MITADDLANHLALIPPLDDADAAWVGDVVAAVNEWVAGLPIIADRADPGEEWPARARAGAIMLAGHLYQSRNSPNGRPSLDGGMSPAYADPEISRLLALRRWARQGMHA